MQRLQKILAQAGIASRRAAEGLIAEGRVTVNGTTIRDMGHKADPAADDIRVDGRRVRPPDRLRYILLCKPAGYVTTRHDPQRRPTVMDLLAGVRDSVYPVGRLDFESEGLILLTNDGTLAAALMHPRHEVPRTYEARVAGVPGPEALDRLRRGVPLDGTRTRPAEVTLLTRDGATRVGLLRIRIREGRNRQVRRMCDAVGHPVRRLRRVQFGPLADRRLAPGAWRDLTPAEVRALQRAVAPPPAPRAAASPRRASAR